MMSLKQSARLFCLGLLLSLFGAGSAMAEALVIVEVRAPDGAPVDGRVVLIATSESAPSSEYACDTEAGKCRIDAVPGGRYRVTFRPKSGEAPAEQRVMIPPSGTVSLIVSARSK